MGSRNQWIRLLPILFLIGGILILFAGCGSVQPQKTLENEEEGDGLISFYVAVDGNDENPGTVEEPFATLDAARKAIREYKENAGIPEGGITVNIRGGAYPLSNSFCLIERDSGAEGAPIIYKAYQDEKVSLIGGVSLDTSAFRVVTDDGILDRLPQESRDKVLQVDLKAQGVKRFGKVQQTGLLELYFNGKPMTPARWPNEGYLKIEGVDEEQPTSGHLFSYSGDRPSRWSQAKDIWAFGYWCFDWSDEALEIDYIDTSAKKIKTKFNSHYGIENGQRYYVYNLLEELDAPGEWYLDRETGILYFYPPESLEGASVQVSTMESPLVWLQNTSYVAMQNLNIEVTRGVGAEIRGGDHNLIAGCTFHGMGEIAVSIKGGTNNGVAGSDIYDTGSGAIQLSGGDRQSLTPAGNYAKNNHIYNYARLRKTYSAAIGLEGVGNIAANNLIHDAPHLAILFSGNDHIMEYNEIYNVCEETSDSGVIYAGRDWTWRGNVIQYNYIHDIKNIGGYGTNAVYLDDAYSSAKVIGNVFYNLGGKAFLIGGGRDNIVENNLMIDNADAPTLDDRGLSYDWFQPHLDPASGTLYARLREVPYQSEVWSSKYPELTNILEDEPAAPKGNIIRNNALYKTPSMNIARSAVETGMVENNVQITGEPGFVDEEKMNFELRDDSVIFEKIPEFVKIPFNRIGLYKDEYRSKLP